jgi:flagellar biosynthesis component FlhA
MNPRSNEIGKYVSKDIALMIMQYAGSNRDWVMYWKNTAMNLIKTRCMDDIVETVIIMNDLYVTLLTSDIMSTHVNLLCEIDDFNTHTVPKYDLLFHTIRDNIRRNITESTWSGNRKIRVVWIPDV